MTDRQTDGQFDTLTQPIRFMSVNEAITTTRDRILILDYWLIT